MKSKKLLSSLMALSIIATSSIAFGNVHAAGVNKDVNIQSATSTSVSSSYSTYCTLSYTAVQDVYQYCKSCSTATDLANYMSSKGYVNQTQALSVAVFLMTNGAKAMTTEDAGGNGVTFLKSISSGKLTVVPVDSNSAGYTDYKSLSQIDVNNVINYLNIKNSISGLTDFLISNNICTSSNANNVAKALCAVGVSGLKSINVSGVLILQEGQINSTNYKYIAVPIPN